MTTQIKEAQGFKSFVPVSAHKFSLSLTPPETQSLLDFDVQAKIDQFIKDIEKENSTLDLFNLKVPVLENSTPFMQQIEKLNKIHLDTVSLLTFIREANHRMKMVNDNYIQVCKALKTEDIDKLHGTLIESMYISLKVNAPLIAELVTQGNSKEQTLINKLNLLEQEIAKIKQENAASDQETEYEQYVVSLNSQNGYIESAKTAISLYKTCVDNYTTFIRYQLPLYVKFLNSKKIDFKKCESEKVSVFYKRVAYLEKSKRDIIDYELNILNIFLFSCFCAGMGIITRVKHPLPVLSFDYKLLLNAIAVIVFFWILKWVRNITIGKSENHKAQNYISLSYALFFGLMVYANMIVMPYTVLDSLSAINGQVCMLITAFCGYKFFNNGRSMLKNYAPAHLTALTIKKSLLP